MNCLPKITSFILSFFFVWGLFIPTTFAANSDITVELLNSNNSITCLDDQITQTVETCSDVSKMRVTITGAELEGIAAITDSALGPISGALDGFDINPLGGGIHNPLDKPGIMFVITSESGSLFGDLDGLDINGLDVGIPARWYIESYEAWDKTSGERYRYPTLNIPITKGIIQFDIKHNIDAAAVLSDGVATAGVGALAGSTLGNGSDLGAGTSAGIGAGIGGVIGAASALDPTMRVTLNIENNYISNIIIPRQIKEGAITETKVANFLKEKTFAAKFELANGIKVNSVVMGDVLEFEGESRYITQEGLSTFNPSDIDGIAKEDSLLNYLVDLVNWILRFVGAIAVIMLVYAGILMVTSMGNEESYGKGIKIIIYAIVGIIVMIASYAIVNTVFNFSGGAYRATFELRERDGGRLIGVDITDGTCVTTTLPLAGEINICNENRYFTVDADSPLIPKLFWPINILESKCVDLQVGIYGCLNARNGSPEKFLLTE